jgi:hypothetical protein
VTQSAGSSSGSFSSVTLILELAGFANQNTFGIYDPLNSSNTLDPTGLTGALTQIFEGKDVGSDPGLKESAKITFTTDGSGGWKITVDEIDTNVQSGDDDATDGTTFTGKLKSNLFGFYITSPQGTFFTDDTRNPDVAGKKAHALVFEGNGNTLTLTGAELADNTFDPNDDWIIGWEDLYNLGDKDYNDLVVKVGGVGKPVPEPLTLLGSGVALSFGAYLKRQAAKKQKKLNS